MKYSLFAAALFALASAPAYSGLTVLLTDNGTLIGALAPGTASLFDETSTEPTVMALAE